MVQYLGLRGYLSEWEARLNELVVQGAFLQWRQMSRLPFEKTEVGKTTRLSVLRDIYNRIR